VTPFSGVRHLDWVLKAIYLNLFKFDLATITEIYEGQILPSWD
jgi:hypothetical protein